MAEQFYVIARPSVGNRVALSDRHPDYPLNEYGEHEVYVAKGVGPVLVAETPEVMRLLAPTNGTLMRVDGAVLEEAKALYEADLERKRQHRESLLLQQRQAKSDEIGEANGRVQDLQLRIAELERKLTGTLAVAEAKAAADRAAQQHEAAVDTAEAEQARAEAAVKVSGQDDAKPAERQAVRRGSAVTAPAPAADEDKPNHPAHDVNAALDAAERERERR